MSELTDKNKQINHLLEVRNLKAYFPIKSGMLRRITGNVKAVDDVSFFIRKGEVFGLVGESGCGKSTLGKVILRLLEPTEGEVLFQGVRIDNLDPQEMRQLRRSMQIIFQDPQGSLNPRMTIHDIIARPMKIFGLVNSKNSRQEVSKLLEKVGLSRDSLDHFPHQLSGGQQQRVGIARAISLSPKFLVLDEPTSSLDVSIQSQITNLLTQLRADFELSYLFISHDLSLIKFISHRIAVMYLGKFVELADKEELYRNTVHPYSQALISAIPRLNPYERKERIILSDTISRGVRPSGGCLFRPRCRYAKRVCESEPELLEIAPRHYVSCHLFGK